MSPDAMVGLDPTAAALAPPPLPPLPANLLTRSLLGELVERVHRQAETLDWSRWFWGEGVLLGALDSSARALGRPTPELVTRYFEQHPVDAITIDHVNSLAPGATSARLGHRGTCERLLAWLESPSALTRASNGAVEHWPGGVWADTVYMMGTFLLEAASLLARPDLARRAAEQWLLHTDLLQLANGLAVHGSHRGEVIACHWGRANAWIALAGCAVLEHPDTLPEQREQVHERLTRQLAASRASLPEGRLWDVLMDGHPETRGIVETSAAAGLCASMLRAAALGIDPDANRKCATQALLRLVPYVDSDGVLTQTSAGTVLQLVPFGYSVIRADHVQLWGQGLLLHALAAALVHLDLPDQPLPQQPQEAPRTQGITSSEKE